MPERGDTFAEWNGLVSSPASSPGCRLVGEGERDEGEPPRREVKDAELSVLDMPLRRGDDLALPL